MRRMTLFALLATCAVPVSAHAQASSCAIPATLPVPHAEGASAQNPRRDVPTRSYTLAVSWSPNYCHGKADSDKDAFQCGGGAGKFGFVLHGLWPDGIGDAWPQYCRTARIVPERVIRGTLCATPSVQLIQHEWSKHGVCTGQSPGAYFARSTGLYRALRFPDMKALAARDDMTVGRFAAAVAALNRGMTPDSMRVTVSKSGWLDELWFCLDTKLRYATCPADSGGVPRSTRLKITDPA